MRPRGTVTPEVINTVVRLTKTDHENIRKEIGTIEPELHKWIKSSVKEDLHDIRCHGVQFMTEEAAQFAGSSLARAKIEGFLIALQAQDRIFASRFFLGEEGEEVPYSRPLNSIMEGQLDAEFYTKLKTSRTKEELQDKEHWKNKAIANFERNNYMREISPDIKKYLDSEKAKEPKEKKAPNNPLAGLAAVDP